MSVFTNFKVFFILILAFFTFDSLCKMLHRHWGVYRAHDNVSGCNIILYVLHCQCVYYGKTTIIFILSIKNLPWAETTTPMRGELISLRDVARTLDRGCLLG